jgi:hypothetical protein
MAENRRWRQSSDEMIFWPQAAASGKACFLPLAANAPVVADPPSFKLVVSYVFPGAIILLALAMIVSHWRTWRATADQNCDDAERAYQQRRFRRRMQTSVMLGLIGAALIVGQWIPPRIWPSTYVVFWCGVVLMVFWVVLLAGADFLSTSARVGRLQRQRAAEQSRLQAELIRLKRQRAEQEQPPEQGDD